MRMETPTQSRHIVTNYKSLNPYQMALRLIRNRISWDMRRVSWDSRSKLRGIFEKYNGKRAVLVCNGPSLNTASLDRISSSGVFSVGLNKINLAFDGCEWRPNLIVAVNSHVIEQNTDFYRSTDIPLVLARKAYSSVGIRDNLIYLDIVEGGAHMAEDCSWSIASSTTVTYAAMQLLYHMGFSEVALIGCDHSFSSKGQANETVVSGGVDPNHFVKNYFSGGQKWQLPDLLGSEWQYQIARDTFAAAGRQIVNCTDGGKLEIFERRRLEDFLSL